MKNLFTRLFFRKHKYTSDELEIIFWFDYSNMSDWTNEISYIERKG